MSEGEKKEVLLQQVMRRLLNEQPTQEEKHTVCPDNSFVFFEKESLQLLISHLLMGQEIHRPQKENRVPTLDVEEVFDQIAAENKKGFEELIAFLKEKS